LKSSKKKSTFPLESIERSKSFGANNIEHYKFKDQTSSNYEVNESSLTNSELHQQEDKLSKNAKRVNSLRQKRQDKMKSNQTEPETSCQSIPSVFLKVKYLTNK
jgi:hypothetical protein